MKRRKPEILAPAGSFDIMKQAFQAGADAVYLGGPFFGARAFASNLTESELLYAIEYAQLHQKKLYLTVNTLLKNDEIDRLFSYLRKPYEAGLDAVIVQDLGVAFVLRQQFPKLELHASTQMSIMTSYGAAYLREMGVTRIVPARELSIAELQELKRRSQMELEVFVHGALCYSYSGLCLFSSMVGGRSGNRGRCAQPCRQWYSCSNGKEGYCLSPSDLCALRQIPELVQAGVDSFKIEGRMKQAEYVVSAVRAYRQAVDSFLMGIPYEAEAWKEKLADIYNRGNFTDGYFHRHNGIEMMAMERNHHNGVAIGTVTAVQGGELEIRLQRSLHRGDVLEVRTKKGCIIELTSGVDGQKEQKVRLRGKQLRDIRIGDMVFRTKNPTICQAFLKECEDGLKEKIHISVILKKDFPAMIEMVCGKQRVTVSGGIVVGAKNQPLQAEELRNKLKKTGEFPFVVSEISLEMDEDCFCSMKEFNQLRRQAMEELELLCRKRHARLKAGQPEAYFAENRQKESVAVQGEKAVLWVAAVSTPEQLQAALDCKTIDRIDLDADYFSEKELAAALEEIRKEKLQGYICLPSIFRKDMEAELEAICKLGADGYVLRTLDELGFAVAKAIQQPLVCDGGVYAYNSAAASQLMQIPGVHLVLPAELSKEELQELTNQNPDVLWEWKLYGKQTVMLTTQCLRKNTDICRKNQPDLTLVNAFQDRYRIHTVCRFCYNKIYQAKPVNLIPEQSELMSVCVYRLTFTDEDAQETLRILRDRTAESDYRGRFWKGME